jgi:hypothetical protein
LHGHAICRAALTHRIYDCRERQLRDRRRAEPASAAIRSVEAEFDAVPVDPLGCGMPTEPPAISVSTRLDPYESEHVVPQRDDETHSQIGLLHLAVIKAAFTCDLTRVVTFQWSPGTNHVSFGGMWDPDPSLFRVHHGVSHSSMGDPNVQSFLTQVDTWYSRVLADFVTELKTTTDAAGKSIFDTTLLPYVTEVSRGDHRRYEMPWLLFGGPDTGLQGGQLLKNPAGQRSTNDLWMACAKVFGLSDFVLGDSDMHTTALSGVFA